MVCRKTQNLTQQYMAYKLGITVNSYANIEQGRVNISVGRLHTIGALLNIKAHMLMALSEEVLETKEYERIPTVLRYFTSAY